MNVCEKRRPTAVSEVSHAAEIPLISTETDPSGRAREKMEGLNMREGDVDKNAQAKRPPS